MTFYLSFNYKNKSNLIFFILIITRDLLLLSAYRCRAIQYNSEGDRLLFLEPQVIDLSTFVSNGNADEGKKKLVGEENMDFDWAKFGISCCFAGSKDELVVVASRKRDLFIWSVPPGRFNSSTAGGAVVEQLMRIPSKFADQGAGLCFSKERSALISSGFGDDQIKVFTSYKLPQQPNS